MDLVFAPKQIETWQIALLLPQAIEATIYSAELVKQGGGHEGAVL